MFVVALVDLKLIGRLDERKRRKDLILERNLLYPKPFEKDLSPEERAICRRYDVFMRFHSKEEHEELLQTVISEHRTKKRIQELKVRCIVVIHQLNLVSLYSCLGCARINHSQPTYSPLIHCTM